tara:strand:- start:7423 stop:7905 length:483 start_codon:yes stop_codon:yes gene_type:complete
METPEQFLENIQTIIASNKETAKYKKRKELQRIIATVVRVTGFDITQKTNLREVADAIKIYSYMARKFTRNGFKEIGNMVNRNHATILIAKNSYSSLYTTDKEFRSIADECLSKHFTEEGFEQPKVKAIEDINDELLKCDHTKLLRVKNYLKKITTDGNK